MLPFAAPAANEPPPTEAELSGLQAFIYGADGAFVDQSKRALAARCARDGHRHVARWRGAVLRCWKCQRCGQETQP